MAKKTKDKTQSEVMDTYPITSSPFIPKKKLLSTSEKRKALGKLLMIPGGIIVGIGLMLGIGYTLKSILFPLTINKLLTLILIIGVISLFVGFVIYMTNNDDDDDEDEEGKTYY